jgi:hypothetical protein
MGGALNNHALGSASLEDYVFRATGPGIVTTYDGLIRLGYSRDADALSRAAVAEIAEARRLGDTGRAEAAARAAVDARNTLRSSTQELLTPGARKLSQLVENPPEWDKISVNPKYAVAGDQFATYENIALAAGRTNSALRVIGQVSRVAGPVGTVVGLGQSAEAIASAAPQERPRVLAREVGSTAFGAAGATAGVALGASAGAAVAGFLVVSNPVGWIVGGSILLGAGLGYLGSVGGSKVGTLTYDFATRK